MFAFSSSQFSRSVKGQGHVVSSTTIAQTRQERCVAGEGPAGAASSRFHTSPTKRRPSAATARNLPELDRDGTWSGKLFSEEAPQPHGEDNQGGFARRRSRKAAEHRATEAWPEYKATALGRRGRATQSRPRES